MSEVFSIAIDGPAGAGKSSVSMLVAEALGAMYLDTGAMYRTIGLYMARQGHDTVEEIDAAADEPMVEVVFEEGSQHMFLNGEDVTELLRSPEASRLASAVAKSPNVRARLVALQREIAKKHSVVMDGRDIGTKVLPDATVKVFLTASAEVRAMRRFKQSGGAQPYDEVLAEINRRDYADSHRSVSPMVPAEDAVLLDSSEMTKQQVIDTICRLKEEKCS